VFYVFEGRYLFEVDGKPSTAAKRNMVVSGEASHAFVNVTEGPARQLV
jgi:hypothetical protein